MGYPFVSELFLILSCNIEEVESLLDIFYTVLLNVYIMEVAQLSTCKIGTFGIYILVTFQYKHIFRLFYIAYKLITLRRGACPP